MVYFTALWRYPDKSIDSILPTIDEPKSINILGLEQLTAEYKDASNANVSANYKNNLEKDLIKKKFANSEGESKFNIAVIDLNPYPGKSLDDILTLKSLGEPQWRIYKHNNIIEIVTRAVEDDEDFLNKPLKEQREITDKIAKEDLKKENDIPAIPTLLE